MSTFQILGVSGVLFYFYSISNRNSYMQTVSEDPDQTPQPHNAASDLGLHRLPMSRKRDARLVWADDRGQLKQQPDSVNVSRKFQLNIFLSFLRNMLSDSANAENGDSGGIGEAINIINESRVLLVSLPSGSVIYRPL